MSGTHQRTRLGAAGFVVVLLVGCSAFEAGEAAEEVLRVVATVDYGSEDTTLILRPGAVLFGADVWASQTVEFEIATDDWIQHLIIYDTYQVEGSDLVPASDAESHEYSLSDQGPSGGSFRVEIPELSEGDHPMSLSIPLSLEPSPGVGVALEPRDATVSVELVYHVWTEPAEIHSQLPTVEELNAAAIDDFQELTELLDCAGVLSFHHGSVENAGDALALASSYVRGMIEMSGHDDLVEAIPIAEGEDASNGVWAIVDSNGHLVGSVEAGQAIFMCENKPPYYTDPEAESLHSRGGDG